MGRIAPRACRSPACSRTTSHVSGFCPDCLSKRRAADDQRRGSAAERGYGTRWQKARATYLASHPLCKQCGERGLIVRATVVDHIIPHKGDQKLFWDARNWQPLCKPCHDKKTATEDGGFGRFQEKG